MFQILALISSRCGLGLVEIKFRAREAGKRSSSGDENGLAGTEAGSLPCFEIVQCGFQISDGLPARSNAEGALLLAKRSGVTQGR